MPVNEVKNQSGNIIGYRWGTTGKLYRTKQEAEKQGRAIYSTGFSGYSNNKSKENE